MIRTVERISLDGGELFSVRDTRPLEVTMARGRAWVTVEDDSRDFFPGAGQTISIPAGRRAVVEALGDAEVAVQVRQGRLAQLLADGLMAMAVGALALRQRVSGLRGMTLRGGGLPGGVAACRNSGC